MGNIQAIFLGLALARILLQARKDGNLNIDSLDSLLPQIFSFFGQGNVDPAQFELFKGLFKEFIDLLRQPSE